MNKVELIEGIAKMAKLTKVDAGCALDSMMAVITKALKGGDTVTLVGFGTFKVSNRAARTGRCGPVSTASCRPAPRARVRARSRCRAPTAARPPQPRRRPRRRRSPSG